MIALRERPALTVLRYAYPGARFHHFAVQGGAAEAIGCGGGETALEAQNKALFEWIERTAFRESGGADATSSGWAAHPDRASAKRNAELELLERDAVLVSWFLRVPPRRLGELSLPAFGRARVASDAAGAGRSFPALGFGRGPGFVVVGVVVENEHGRMLLSAAAPSEKECLRKLTIDSERAAHLLATGGPADRQLAAHHRSFCAMPAESLAWLYEDGDGLSYDEVAFRTTVEELPLWDGSRAYVARAESAELQPLFFGETAPERLHPLRVPFAIFPARHPLL